MASAHSANALGVRHDLTEHLISVAEMAGQFGRSFSSEEVCYWLGLWHDLGKFNPRFQQYLAVAEVDRRGRKRGPDHKAAGARLAQEQFGILALAVQAHHGGLHNPQEYRQWISERLRDSEVDVAIRAAREALREALPLSPIHLPEFTAGDVLASELYVRMLLSALVDADRLDTEAHFQADRAARRQTPATMVDLWDRFERNQSELTRHGTGPVNAVRQEVYRACLEAAAQPPGMFRLTVPTGAGKTRSAMAFALQHALLHGLRRVVVAVPYISITEQTAQEYRRIFESVGPPEEMVVLEHHTGTAVDVGDEEGSQAAGSIWARLAAENWDAAVVITTTVQLFESLFAASSSRVRKLHRLARSVIILDETQSLPATLLEPILHGLQQLCTHYGATVVLSTATQPAFEEIPAFRAASAREIVPAAGKHFSVLKRVNYEWHIDQPMAWDEVAELLRSEDQALAVLNTKKDALALLRALDDPDAVHLSTSLCGAHRRAVLGEVRARLASGRRCLLVSTQVVEAGVDLDFPVVVRALGPLDSVIQAAGRCNREGRLERGRVIVFVPRDGTSLPAGYYRTATQTTRTMLGRGHLDPDDPDTSREYFRLLYQSIDTDAAGVQALRRDLNYPEVARKFRMIPDDTESVVVHYAPRAAQVLRLIDELRDQPERIRETMRRLQPFLVNLRSTEAGRCRKQGLIMDFPEHLSGLRVSEWGGSYHPVYGLLAEDMESEVLIL